MGAYEGFEKWAIEAGPGLLEKARKQVKDGEIPYFDADDILGTYCFALHEIDRLNAELKKLQG